jgi:glycosyltransferase involved in cell wall biosynthesis
MKLSFVIPAFNEENYIRQCLESIINETKRISQAAEIIVVNNASTDGTGEIARQYPGVRVIDEPKKGTSQARQTGFLASQGELVAFIDSDVILPKGWIDKIFWEFENNEELVALSGPYTYYDLPKSYEYISKVYNFFALLIHFIGHYIFRKGAVIQGANSVLRRRALEKIGGFDVSIVFHGDDTDLARRIQKEGRVKFTFSLVTFASGRRLKKEGLLKAGWNYIVNYFWVIFFKKPFTNKYTYVGDIKKINK